MRVDLHLEANAELAEGPRWDAERGALLWVDIERGEVHHGDSVLRFPERVGAAAPVEGGGLLVATATALVLDGTEVARFAHGPGVRTNDGACDPQGRFWIGTMALDERPGLGALYRYDGTLTPLLTEVGMSNGLDWSPDGSRLYYVDSLTQRLDVFDYDGEISGRRTLAAIDPDDGIPDGLAVDDEGGVWLALHGGGCVRRYGADGTLEHELAIPARNVTSCCFGGDDGRALFVTTAAPDGHIYVAEPGVSGPPARAFRTPS